MIENRKYQIMLREVEDLLAREYTDAELMKLKDDIRGLALYGNLSEYESYSLLEKLPHLSVGYDLVEDEPVKHDPDEEAPNTAAASFAEFGSTPYDGIYSKNEDEMPDEKKSVGGFDFASGGDTYSYNPKDHLDDYDDEPSTPGPARSGFGFDAAGDVYGKKDLWDDDDDDENYTKPKKQSGFDIF